MSSALANAQTADWRADKVFFQGFLSFLRTFMGKKHSISNRLTVSKGFDRRLSPAEEQVLPPSLYILLAANILREYSVHLAKRYGACFLSA